MIKIQHSFYIKKEKNELFFINSWKKKNYKITTIKAEEIFRILIFFQRKSNFFEEDLNIELKKINLSFDYIHKFLNFLYEKKILIKINQKVLESYARYNRQELFFSNFEDDNLDGIEINKKIQEKKILIIGLGGYGSWLAMFCARMGIKNIFLLDFDIIEISNLNRQVLYTEKDIGEKKIDICKREIKNIDSSINVHCYDMKINTDTDLFEIFKEIDMVFNTFGYFDRNSKYSKVSNCILEASRKYKVSCFNFNGSFIGPISLNGNIDNYNKFINKKEIRESIAQSLANIEYRNYVSAFIPRVAISCSIAIWEVTRFLCEIEGSDFLIDNVLILDTVKYTNNKIISLKE